MRVLDLENKFKDVTDSYNIEEGHHWILINSKEVNLLKNKFNLKEEDIIECKNYSQSAQINFYEQYVFVILNVLEYEDSVVNSSEFNIFLGENYIITVYKEDLGIVTDLLMDIRESKNCFMLKEKPSPDILLYYIMDRVIVKDYDVISQLETKADKIEINILKKPKHEYMHEVIHLRRQVYRIRKYITPLRYIGDSLVNNDNLLIKKEYIKNYMSLNNKIEKLMMALETLVQDLSLVREAYESEIGNEANELMKVFTIVAAIFLPADLITSFYGMNFNNIPPMNCKNGCFYILFLMVISSMALIWFFKKKKWL
ncbi:magnesium transporter CorA family protein [Clostridium oceanicum]|uniref:Magnesium transporter CorA family protein n=1 Tax=Clostridium oceanicum TaxID=1543 RepID=A0ABN1JSX7_9CLOT